MCTALEELKQDWKNEGLSEGLSEGRSEGIQIGENRIMTLVSYMLQDGAVDDILRLKSDEGFKKEMLGKYQL